MIRSTEKILAEIETPEYKERMAKYDRECELKKAEILKLIKEKENKPEFIKNTSGWKPLEYRILILPEEFEQITKQGIILAVGNAIEDQQQAKTIATIIDFGAKAFDDGTWKDKPNVGDKIIIPSYCGYRLTKEQTQDGKEYRTILDRDILAMQTNEEICQ